MVCLILLKIERGSNSFSMTDSIYATGIDVIFFKECIGHCLRSSAAISVNWFVLQLPNNGSLIKTRQSIIIPRQSAFIYLRSRNRPISALQAVSAGQCDMPSNQTLPLDHTSATATATARIDRCPSIRRQLGPRQFITNATRRIMLSDHRTPAKPDM